MNKLLDQILLLLLVVSLTACASGKDGSVAENSNKQEAITQGCIQIKLSRGACYGTCPVYEATIDDAGGLFFVGKDFVENTGDAKADLDAGDVKDLFKAVEALDWQSYPDEYPIDNYDFPQWRLQSVCGGVTKQIKGNTNAAAELIALTEQIDQILLNQGFIKAQ